VTSPSTAAASDPFDLARFETAQAANFSDALQELRDGCKATHWMWYVFPQIDGLGSSAMAKRYAIKSTAEARAYLAHPVLGARLRQCVEALLQVSGKSAHEILGSPDDLKLHSSLTLFVSLAAGPDQSLFQRALDRYYRGQLDERTLALLRA